MVERQWREKQWRVARKAVASGEKKEFFSCSPLATKRALKDNFPDCLGICQDNIFGCQTSAKDSKPGS
jgi:hypothetical protein